MSSSATVCLSVRSRADRPARVGKTSTAVTPRVRRGAGRRRPADGAGVAGGLSLERAPVPISPSGGRAGAGLAALHIRRRALAIAIATGLVLVTGWRGAARFGMRNAEGPVDTHLMLAERYGSVAASLAASPEGLEGDLLVLTPQGPKPGAAREPPRGGPLGTRLVFSPLEKATFGGLGIRLLHPGVTSVTFSGLFSGGSAAFNQVVVGSLPAPQDTTISRYLRQSGTTTGNVRIIVEATDALGDRGADTVTVSIQ